MFSAFSAVVMLETARPRSSISFGTCFLFVETENFRIFWTFVSANVCQLRSRKKVRFLSSILKAFSNGAGNFVSGIFVLFSSFF